MFVGLQRFETFKGFDLNDSQNVLQVPFNNAILDDTGNRIAYYPLFASGFVCACLFFDFSSIFALIGMTAYSRADMRPEKILRQHCENTESGNFQFQLIGTKKRLTLFTCTFFRPYISSEKAISLLV